MKSAGSFDTVAPLYRLTKNNTVHVLCTPTGQKNFDGFDVYNPLKIYVIQDEDNETLLKTFKYEVGQVKAHFSNKVEGLSHDEKTPDNKCKATDNHLFSSPGWPSAARRLKICKTNEAAAAGIVQEAKQ